MGPKTNIDKNGAAQAALLAAMLGVLTLSLVNLGTEMSKAFETNIYNLGKLWMPGAQGIGPYSGKETVSLVAWLLSWFVLHRILRAKEWNHQGVLTIFLVGVAIATTLLWPPVTHWAAHPLGG